MEANPETLELFSERKEGFKLEEKLYLHILKFRLTQRRSSKCIAVCALSAKILHIQSDFILETLTGVWNG
jgi:hypothetical protein